MLGHHFYNRTIRNLTVAFGSLFTDIKIDRFATDGSVVQTIQVPLSYAPAQKTAIRQIEQSSPTNDVEGKTNIKMVLPRMSYDMTGMVYDAERARNRNFKTTLCDENGQPTKWMYSRVPYNFSFVLNVLTRKTEDGLQIIEQIIPFFSPSLTISVVDIPAMGGVPSDIPITLDDISHDDNYETEFQEQRELTWTLSFTLKGWLYFPVIEDVSGIIEKIIINYNPMEAMQDPSLLWETTVIVANASNTYPTVVTVLPTKTERIDTVDLVTVVASKWIMVIEDYKQEHFKRVIDFIVVSNGTDVDYTILNDIGDTVDTPFTMTVVDGQIHIDVTNNTNYDTRFKFIRLNLEK